MPVIYIDAQAESSLLWFHDYGFVDASVYDDR